MVLWYCYFMVLCFCGALLLWCCGRQLWVELSMVLFDCGTLVLWLKGCSSSATNQLTGKEVNGSRLRITCHLLSPIQDFGVKTWAFGIKWGSTFFCKFSNSKKRVYLFSFHNSLFSELMSQLAKIYFDICWSFEDISPSLLFFSPPVILVFVQGWCPLSRKSFSGWFGTKCPSTSHPCQHLPGIDIDNAAAKC